MQNIWDFLPSALLFFGSILFMVLVHFGLNRWMKRSIKRDVIKGLADLGVGLAGTILVVMFLPLDQVTRENILKIGGLIVTGIVAFSSTTVIRDAAAGATLRFISAFGRGDYLSTDQYFGRITEVGFFHVELQTEDRTLVTLPNSRLLESTFKTIPSSGTMLTTTVSLGYDEPLNSVENTLLEAAENAGLTDAFVHVKKVGDFAITYKVAGLLEDVENLLTERSNFRKSVIKHLHKAGIQIVSPDFLNKRDFPPEQKVIPESVPEPSPEEVPAETSKVVFEKALDAKKAEELDQLKSELEEKIKNATAGDSSISEDERQVLKDRIEMIESRKEEIEEKLQSDDSSSKSDGTESSDSTGDPSNTA